MTDMGSERSSPSEAANVAVLIQRLRAAEAGGLREQTYQTLCGDAADALSASPVTTPSETAVNCALFVRWALQEGSWQGGDLDGGTIQEKAESLGLIVAVPYDPEKHGAYNDYGCDAGDPWFEFSPDLRAIRLSTPPASLTEGRDLDHRAVSGSPAPEIVTPAPSMPWQPIETAPRDREIWAFNGEQARMVWCEGDESLWLWADELLDQADPEPEQPTHWMHLPAPPAALSASKGEGNGI